MPGALDPREITVAAYGEIHVAPYGVDLPEDSLDDLDPEFVNVGYATEDGATFTNTPATTDINAWQSNVPVRRLVTGRTTTVGFTMMQWNMETFALAFGGGDWSEPSPGIFRYDPPSDVAALAEWSIVIDGADGDKRLRWVVYRATVGDAVETSLVRGGPALLPVSATALAAGVDRAWHFLTDADEFAVAS